MVFFFILCLVKPSLNPFCCSFPSLPTLQPLLSILFYLVTVRIKQQRAPFPHCTARAASWRLWLWLPKGKTQVLCYNQNLPSLALAALCGFCPIPNTYTTLLENGNLSKAQFKMKVFSFVNNSVLYLYCRINIFMESPGRTCRTGIFLLWYAISPSLKIFFSRCHMESCPGMEGVTFPNKVLKETLEVSFVLCWEQRGVGKHDNLLLILLEKKAWGLHRVGPITHFTDD